MAKDKGKDKGKSKGKAKGKAQGSDDALTLINHSRASQGIRKARAIGGIAGLVLTAYAAHKGGLPTFDVGFRALIGGLAGSLIAWAVAVVAWRHLVIAEVRAAHARAHAPAQVPAPVPSAPDAPRFEP